MAAIMGKETRIRDRLDVSPRFRESDAIRLNNMFRGRDTAEMLESVLGDGLAGDVTLVSSFGADSAVLRGSTKSPTWRYARGSLKVVGQPCT